MKDALLVIGGMICGGVVVLIVIISWVFRSIRMWW